jgi:hypothetical protein
MGSRWLSRAQTIYLTRFHAILRVLTCLESVDKFFQFVQQKSGISEEELMRQK